MNWRSFGEIIGNPKRFDKEFNNLLSVIEWITKWSEFLSFNSTRTTDYNILNGEGDVKPKEMSLIVFVQYFGEVKKIRNSKP